MRFSQCHTHDNILRRISEIANDRKTDVKARFSFTQLLSGGGGVVRESSSHMTSNDRLELAKDFLQNVESLQTFLTNDPLYASQLKDYDVLLESYRKELAILEDKMKQQGALSEEDRMRSG